eukprot:TRINITY_DN51308_c0_g1_i1.p1 TRINITY_DN51308_c0_g1~~TRINITY_DN51308_c0_g1_i1.p1  ORF type:complete len:611 (+),score=110.64 TRINITY_DN51308_c0_g1_i1:55-1833(+)
MAGWPDYDEKSDLLSDEGQRSDSIASTARLQQLAMLWDAKGDEKFGFLHLARSDDLKRKAAKQLEYLAQCKNDFKVKLQEVPIYNTMQKDVEWRRKVAAAKDFQAGIASVTPKQFMISVSLLRSRTADYLDNMSMQLLTSEWREWPWLQHEEELCDTMVPFGFDMEKVRVEGPGVLKVPPAGLRYEWKMAWNYMFASNRTDHSVHWIPAPNIIAPRNSSDRLRIIKALHDTGTDSGVWNLPICQAILLDAWNKYAWHYRIGRLMDIVFMEAIGNIQYFVIYKQAPMQQIPWFTPTMCVASALCCCKSIFDVWAVALMAWCEFGFIEGMTHWLTIWNVMLSVVEVTSACILLPLLYEEFLTSFTEDHRDSSAFLKHPVMLSCVVGLRWIFLLMGWMCSYQFGRNVFPAWHAMTRPAVLWFTLFITLGTIAAFQSYMSFDIGENKETFWTPVMKVFRLAVLGDFDVFELEGVDSVVQKPTEANATYVYEINDGEVSKEYHDGIMIFVMVTSVSITILSMNVAIGVVGKAYEDAKAEAVQIHGHFCSGFLFNMMLAAKVMERSSDRKEDDDEDRSDEEVGEDIDTEEIAGFLLRM